MQNTKTKRGAKMSLKNDLYDKEVAKAKILVFAICVFGNDISILIPSTINKNVLYNEVTILVEKNESSMDQEIILAIYNKLSPKMASAYDKAKYWASHFSDDLNYPLNTGQIMRAFRGQEDKLIADEQVDVDFIVRTLENVGFDLSGWNVSIATKQDKSIVLSESRLNDNFSEPVSHQTPAYPGYDVLADIIPSNIPEGNEHYAMT